LPDHSEACYATAESGGVDCDYPADNLFKIFWPGLQAAAPDAYTLLQNMQYSTEDQISMIAAVELDGVSVEDAAQAWIDANAAVWQSWLPQ
jgi:glycine betaine/proline transport system substrate-binding protein